jgi:hypothetical protein
VTRPALPCIVCGTALTNVVDMVPNQPNDGVVCHTYGNYGSTVYDPISDSRKLEFNVCDECLTNVSRLGWVVEITRGGEERKVWNGE